MEKFLRIFLFLGLTGFHSIQSALPIRLPVEVLGTDGTTMEIAIQIDRPEEIASLWMLINGIAYPGMASLSLNSGAWIAMDNSTMEVLGKSAKAYGGLGGGFSTVKVKMAIKPGSLLGSNILRFRFNKTDGVSMGFRVVDLNLLNGAGARMLPASAFQSDDPGTWMPPLAGADMIAQGKVLWSTATLKESPITGSPTLKAKCMDCHAWDGRDLKYFSFSNLSIIERSKFHGLTPDEGKKIASYIRSLNVPNPGRPWNPPYQPGPGIDAKPVSHWAAGAGIEWVLDEDAQSLPYVFTRGTISAEDIATNGTLNAREVPISMQLPDWNHWLPRIHPKDAWGDAFTNSTFNKAYNGEGSATVGWNLREKLRSQGEAYLFGAEDHEPNSLRRDLFYFYREGENFLAPRYVESNNPPWSGRYAHKIYSTSQWRMVKAWELMQEFDLEDRAPRMYGAKGESRSWFGRARFLFDTSPHILRIPSSPGVAIGGSATAHLYFANAWYHAQMVVNSGNRSGGATHPVDWAYSHGVLKDLNVASGNPEAIRMLITLVKGTQAFDNGISPIRPDEGWSDRNATASRLVQKDYQPMWAATHPIHKRDIMQAYLRTWLGKHKQYGPSDYARVPTGNADSEYPIPPADYVPRSNPIGSNADKIFFMLPEFRKAGVDGALLNDIADWAKTLWPNGNWESLKGGTAAIDGIAPAIPISVIREFGVRSKPASLRAGAGKGSGRVFEGPRRGSYRLFYGLRGELLETVLNSEIIPDPE